MSRALEACWFDADDAGQYARMARLLERSAKTWCPGWDIRVRRLPAIRGDVCSAAANTRKLEHWASAVAAARDGDELLLIDADAVILLPLDHIWLAGFDFAYTLRRPGQQMRFPINAGVVFLRVGRQTRAFFEAWRAENERLRRNPPELERWRRTYGGMNQAALGSLLEAGIVEQLKLHVVKLDCAEWNCEDSSWDAFDPSRTRILHVKSGLRRACFNLCANPRLRPLVRVWRALEQLPEPGPRPPA